MPVRLRKKLITTIMVPAIMMAVATVALLWQLNRAMYDARWVEHTDQVRLLIQTAKAEFLTATNALRDFLRTSDPAYRDSMQEHWRKSQAIIEQLGPSFTTDNATHKPQIANLKRLESEWLRVAASADPEQSIAQKREFVERTGAIGSKMLDAFDAMSAVEEQLQIVRDERRDSQYRLLMRSIPVAALILTVGLMLSARKEIRRASDAFADALRSAEEANNSRTQFLAVVSHELRNPLNSILLWCNTLRSSGALDAKADQGLKAIERSAKTQAQLVEDLLDISRIETGQMRLDVRPVNLAELVRAAIDSMRPAAEAKSISLETMLDLRATPFAGDPNRLQQAVWNLLSNAIKFTPRGGKVQVRLERTNSHLEISVADNGQGIDRQALENVFDRFWQASKQGAGDHGMGLGLSIVRHIVNLHGGSVTADSEGQGKGSVFAIRFPLALANAALTRRPSSVSPTRL